MTESPAQQQLSLSQLIRLVFLPFATGYFLSYLFRSVNAVISGDLQADAGLTAAQLGLMTSAYFLAFASFQLPLGVLLDRYGPRRVEAWLLLLAAAGSLLFALGQGMAGLTLGRALIGLGVSACLMGSFKAFVLWFPVQRLPLVNGWLLAFGGLGAMVATAPVEWAVGVIGWRWVFVLLGLACLGSAALIGGLVPEKRDESVTTLSVSDQIQALGEIFRSDAFWRVAPIALVSQGTSLAVGGLWAGPWLRDVAGMDRSGVATYLLFIAIAITVGFAAWGTITDRLSRAGVPVRRVAMVGVGATCLITLLIGLQVPVNVLLLWVLFSFFATSGTLMYALLTQQFAGAVAGRVNTALNLMVFLGAFGVQWGIGLVIQFWELPGGVGYDPAGYRVAFLLVSVLQVAAFLWFIRPRRGDAAA
ncbi:MAG: MFS transporter [Ectothiorhodospiraceae bacterium]|nr:MFS transporter [Ectothiorhodospiraceae bacterium]